MISTNTFQLTRRALYNHFRDDAHREQVGAGDLEDRAERLLRAATKLAVEARDAAANGRPVAVAGAITTLEWCFRPDLAPTPEQARAEYVETIGTLADAGCDLVLIETVNSVAEAKVALEAANEVGLPCWVAFAPTEDGKLFTGETMAAGRGGAGAARRRRDPGQLRAAGRLPGRAGRDGEGAARRRRGCIRTSAASTRRSGCSPTSTRRTGTPSEARAGSGSARR